MKQKPTRSVALFAAMTVLGAAPLSGCMFGALQDNLDELEHYARISGTIEAVHWNESPIVIGLLRLAEVDGAPDHPIDKIEHHGLGEYFFIVRPGRYRVVAYEDTNRNFRWDEGERVTAYNNFAPIAVQAGELRGQVNIHITDRTIQNVPEIADEDLQRSVQRLGAIVPIESPRFGPASGPRGLWRPMEFLDDPGWGLFLLGAYDPSKVPVLFVHGISGYPQEFASLIAGLDHERFQPWVVHYPSGFDLEIVATALQRVLNDMRRRHGYDHMCLVAHSMGGVLARLFLKRYPEDEGRVVHTFVTIDSPLAGMPSAAMGVASAPVVVPSWRNLDPEGETIPSLYEIPLPEGLEYHLFFSHIDGQTDTVVSLATQLRAEAMAEATSMQGFSNTHGGVLRSAEASRHLNTVLARCGEMPASDTDADGDDVATVDGAETGDTAAPPPEPAQ